MVKNIAVVPEVTGDSTLGEFINENWFSVLVINNEADKRTGMHALPILEPRKELVIRIEPDTKKHTFRQNIYVHFVR